MRIGVVGTGRIGALHAQTLVGLDGVEDVVVTDARIDGARRVAAELHLEVAPSLEAMLVTGVDGLVIATSTPSHAHAVRAGIARRVPTFCEKPVAATLDETVALARLEAAAEVPVQVGFQRRFDAGYRRVRAAVEGGELGVVHLVRAVTHDQAPPPADYLPRSGGIFRDMSIHDLDVIRYVTGREPETVYAAGGNKGAGFFREADDVDTAAALITMDDGTLVVVSGTRYNGAGHDVRMEVTGSLGAMAVGLDDSLALDSAEPGAAPAPGPRHWSFVERFRAAYAAEMRAFVRVVSGELPSPCTVHDGLQAARTAEACDRSRREGRPVAMAEIADASAWTTSSPRLPVTPGEPTPQQA